MGQGRWKNESNDEVGGKRCEGGKGISEEEEGAYTSIPPLCLSNAWRKYMAGHSGMAMNHTLKRLCD